MQRGSVLPVLLLIVFVAVIASAGFVYFRNVNLKSAGQPIPKSTPSIAPSIKTQTISEDLLGLKFEIPLKYSFKKETEEEYFKRAFGNIRKNFAYYVLYQPAELLEAFYIISDTENNLDKALLTVWVFKNPDGLDAKGFYDKYWYYPFVWGDFTEAKNKIAPESIELIDGKEGKFGIVTYRDLKPRFTYLELKDKNLMMQIQYPDGNLEAREILKSFKFE